MTAPSGLQHNVDLSQWSWWKVGGPADHFIAPTTIEGVREALQWAHAEGHEVTVLGGGTNVLISDKGVRGLVLCTRELKAVDSEVTDGRLRITSLAGTPKSELVKLFLKHKLPPALFVCGLPGDVGGGVVMNAGVSEMITPREFCEIVDWVEVLSLDAKADLKHYAASEQQWHYRRSEGWQPGVVLRAGISWPMEPDPEIMKKVKQATKARLQRQPLDLPSCGSVFKNPEGHKSGALIEQSGLKGYQVGGAQVSPKHANFIVNIGNARASEIHQIIEHVKSTVKTKFNVDLQTEVRYLGEWK